VVAFSRSMTSTLDRRDPWDAPPVSPNPPQPPRAVLASPLALASQTADLGWISGCGISGCASQTADLPRAVLASPLALASQTADLGWISDRISDLVWIGSLLHLDLDAELLA
ncbi:MAG: hypothetical protein WBN38_01325, partial [Polyangiales bacterium]